LSKAPAKEEIYMANESKKEAGGLLPRFLQAEPATALGRRDFLKGGGVLVGGLVAAASLARSDKLVRAAGVTSRPTRYFHDPRAGTTLTWAEAEDPTFFIPMCADATETWVFSSLMYESLVAWDRNLNIVPALATSWSNPNPTTFIFNLRKGVLFHSGKELDAEDVKYSIGIAANPPPPGINAGFYPPIVGVDVLDKYTVKVRTSTPSPALLGFFAWNRYVTIVPNGFYESTDVRTHVDGTGPFMLGTYVPNDHTTLVANPHYWRPGVPGVETLVMKVIPVEGTRLDAVRSGEVDGGDAFSYTSVRVANADPSLKILKSLTAAFNEIECTLNDSKQPWFDYRVRQAINWAINREDIINKVFSGQAVITGQIPAGYGDWPLPVSTLSAYEKYDPNRAKSLLKEAGYPTGFQMTMNSIAQPLEYTQVAEVVAAQLSQVGIEVTVIPMEIAEFAHHDSEGTYDFESTGRGMRDDPSGFMADFNPAGSLYKADFKGWYKALPHAAEFLKLLNQGQSTLNVKTRHAIYNRLQTLVLTDWPEYPLVNAYAFDIVGPKVRGMYNSYTGAEPGLITATVSGS
jgi:ABC-type transport system substrate-binding protein